MDENVPLFVSSAGSWAEQLGCWCGRAAAAVVTDDICWSGDELLARASGAAAWLDAIGLSAGSVVPALVSAGPPAIALAVAGGTTHRPLAPLGPRLTVPELVACVARIDSPLLVCSAAHIEVAQAVAALTGRQVAVMPTFVPAERTLTYHAAPDQLAFMVHTSGTSGVPKAVPVPQRAVVARNDLICGMEGIGPGSVFASASPFHHIAGIGMIAGALGCGAAVVPMPQFTVTAWRALAQHGVTHALAVPSMIDMLLAEGTLKFGETLRLVQYGSARMDVSTLRAAMDAMPDVAVVQLYGQTEGSPITWLTMVDHQQALNGRPDLLASVGRAVPGLSLRIDSPDAEGVGEILARAPHLLVPDEQGWLHTGDLGRLDDEGYLYLSGRRDDMIIRGGENLHPVEIETVLLCHPGVREVAVVGVPDRRWGETVKAFIVATDPTQPPDPDTLRAFTRQHLAGFKVPVVWSFIDSLPRNSAGKVLRRVLKKLPHEHHGH